MTDSVSGVATGESFVLGLEENAIDSLVHAVEHFLADERPTDLKYTVLHIFHAVELFLKARLAKVDPELIYRNSGSGETRYTVDFRELKKRLCNVNVILSQQDEESLKRLKEVRNSIEHHRIEHNRDDIEEYVGCAIYFLETFLLKELGISLKEQLDEVDEDAYQTLSKAWLFHLKRMADSGVSLHPHPKEPMVFEFFTCEHCQEEAVVVPDPRTSGDAAYCFCCFSHYLVEVSYCPRCEMSDFSISGPDETATAIEISRSPYNVDDQSEQEDWPDNWSFCERCMDHIADS
jgi:hypothetical protein